jgi:O-antigen/teichoic acid export membrane protein
MRDQLSVWHVIIISMVSIVVAYFTGNYFLHKKILKGYSDVTPAFDKKNWTSVAFSLFLVSGIYFYLSQLQILSLGFFKGAAETGIFAIASRLSDLEGYMLFALNVVLAPLISKMWAEQRKAELQSLLRKSLWFGFVFSLPVVICFLVFPGFFLNLFGDEFGDGTFVLIVLTLSQIVNFGTGSVGYILTMTGHQKIAIRLLILSALFATLLSVLFVPSFGKNGAALAAAINNVILNVALTIVVYRKTGINPTLLSFK